MAKEFFSRMWNGRAAKDCFERARNRLSLGVAVGFLIEKKCGTGNPPTGGGNPDVDWRQEKHSAQTNAGFVAAMRDLGVTQQQWRLVGALPAPTTYPGRRIEAQGEGDAF